ncbi:MAG: pyruvate kinase alpha/beta domain-containing protein [Candidatus Bathyarchaeia archaeon]|nr:hypothetical protein [Candidatus Bathyarchaeota archaeon]
MEEGKIVYFESGGKHNTEKTLEIVKERLRKGDIKKVVLASVTGYSAEKALTILKDTNAEIIVVGVRGLGPGFPAELKQRLKESGHKVIFAEDVTINFPEVVKETLWRFCEGMKVCVEIVLIATDAGLLQPGEEVIAVAGTGPLGYEKGGGVDTAIVMEAIRSGDFLQLETIYGMKEKRRKIKEILCKPR